MTDTTLTAQQSANCTCPSGDGSLCWPCPAHPPVAQQSAPVAATGPNLYRKTALVQAEQFLPAEGKIPAGVISDGHGDPRTDARFSFVLQTLEGVHQLRNGDYICTGPAGEKWNVERSIFESTYECAAPAQVEAAPQAAPLPTMRAAFRTEISEGQPRRYAMRFEFPSLDDLNKAGDEWRAFAAQPAQACSALVATGLPERDQSKPAEQQGLFHKFDIRRVDGSDQPGGKHYGCRYYVLDLTHDQHAPGAMRAYAAACRATHPQLADDIEAEFGVAATGAEGAQQQTQACAPGSDMELEQALDAEYPIPDNPHASVIDRAHNNRAAFERGWLAKERIEVTSRCRAQGGNTNNDGA